MKVDYMMQEYHGGRNDGFLTDKPRPFQSGGYAAI